MLDKNGGATNAICEESTDFNPTETPLIDIEMPLNSIGRLGTLWIEPTDVRGVTAGVSAVSKFATTIEPGETPSTAAGVVGDGLGVGVGVGVGVGDTVGDGVTGKPLAPVKKLTLAVPVPVTFGFSR